jgi:hypothetical protein
MHCSGVDETATGSANFWSDGPAGRTSPDPDDVERTEPEDVASMFERTDP